jgi:hypothetical protein
VTDEDLASPTADCHNMLLRLAGRLPDDLITLCRQQLAHAELGQLARALTSCALSLHVPLATADIAVLTGLLAATGGDPSPLRDAETDDSDPVEWNFTSEAPDPGHQITAVAALDQAIAHVLAFESSAIGCWRAWRIPAGESAASPAKPVFVIETTPGADPVSITAVLQRQLTAAGEPSPQVEVCLRGQQLPAYQTLARAYGELIWTATEDPGLQIAAIFDTIDPEVGPQFLPDHPRLDTDEAAKVARYLLQAEPVLVTSAQMDDVVDTNRQSCVPLDFRTDGRWIWTEASAYYAQEHLLEPDPELLAHIRSNNHTVPEVDAVAVHRALEVLQHSPDGEPTWTFGAPDDEQAPAEDSYNDDYYYYYYYDNDDDQDDDDADTEVADTEVGGAGVGGTGVADDNYDPTTDAANIGTAETGDTAKTGTSESADTEQVPDRAGTAASRLSLVTGLRSDYHRRADMG